MFVLRYAYEEAGSHYSPVAEDGQPHYMHKAARRTGRNHLQWRLTPDPFEARWWKTYERAEHYITRNLTRPVPGDESGVVSQFVVEEVPDA